MTVFVFGVVLELIWTNQRRHSDLTFQILGSVLVQLDFFNGVNFSRYG